MDGQKFNWAVMVYWIYVYFFNDEATFFGGRSSCYFVDQLHVTFNEFTSMCEILGHDDLVEMGV